MATTIWKGHIAFGLRSVRGFLSGIVGKKLGLSVASVKDRDGVLVLSGQ